MDLSLNSLLLLARLLLLLQLTEPSAATSSPAFSPHSHRHHPNTTAPSRQHRHPNAIPEHAEDESHREGNEVHTIARQSVQDSDLGVEAKSTVESDVYFKRSHESNSNTIKRSSVTPELKNSNNVEAGSLQMPRQHQSSHHKISKFVPSLDVNFDLLFASNLETYENEAVTVSGAPLPAWLRGVYIRNGMGAFELGPRHMQHAFDAFAKLVSFRFNGSAHNVLFSHRMVDTNFYTSSVSSGTIAPYLLFSAPAPPFSLAERAMALVHGIDNTNINVLRVKKQAAPGHSYLAVSDFWQAYEFDADTLRTLRRLDPELAIRGPDFIPLPSTAHPVREYGTSNYISYVSVFDLRLWGQHTINVIRIYSDTQRDVIATIPVPQVPYMHSLAVTQRHAVIVAHPLYVNVWRMVRTANPADSLDWHPHKHTQLYVVDLLTGAVSAVRTRLPALFHMHHVNSYQPDARTIIVDYITYPDTGFMKALELGVMRDPARRNLIDPKATLIRYTIDLVTKTASSRTFPSTSGYEFVSTMDMPAINEDYRFRKHCYVYGVTFKSDGVWMANTSLVKKDVCSEGADMAWFTTAHYVSEPWFVPAPNGIVEDEGVLLSLILDGTKSISYLAVIDPQTMKLQSRVDLPTAVPFTLHGNFFADDDNDEGYH